jgi:hypothetical protein
MDVRVSKMNSNQNKELLSMLMTVQRRGVPFHPLILVFATGDVSTNDCVPMKRSPMPPLGAVFTVDIGMILKVAHEENASIHDGAIIFSKEPTSARYKLAAWSARIVSNATPKAAEPNRGSAHNSAVSLSESSNIDLCCILTSNGIIAFQDGVLVSKTTVP